MFGFLDDVLEVGSEIAVGAVTGAIGAKIGKEVTSKVTGGNRTAENIGEIAGALGSGYLGAEMTDSLFDLLGDSDD